MVRFKQFSGTGSELEKAVNAWLGEYEPDVTQMVQTVNTDGKITLCLLFDESFRGQEIRLASERVITAPTAPTIPEEAMRDKPIAVPQEPGQYTSDSRTG
ncbi:MAG: hypothetical protein ACR2JC_19820 [Chloroflexota bacterium]|nr:MAG: hypothetical protein DLM70_09010 [Chloroflexota bacterium]